MGKVSEISTHVPVNRVEPKPLQEQYMKKLTIYLRNTDKKDDDDRDNLEGEAVES